MTKRIILTVLLVVTALFLAACEVEQEGEGPDATLTPGTSPAATQPTSVATPAQATPTATPAAPATTPTQTAPTATPANPEAEKAQQALEADRAKPRFRGEMGDFVVVDATTGYPCPGPDQPLLNLEQSDLPFEFPGAVVDEAAAQSCQGAVMRIADEGGTSKALRDELETDFRAAARDPSLIQPLGKKLQKCGLFAEYEDRFFALVKSKR